MRAERDEAYEMADGQNLCSRSEWCVARTVTFVEGERVCVPALTPRFFCDPCADHIGWSLEDPEEGLPALYGRLAGEIAEARQAEVLVRMPFGPQVPLSEAIDAHMRLMCEVMFSWEERIRAVARLSDLPAEVTERPQATAADLGRSVSVISPRMASLLYLERQEMIRVLPRRALATWTADEDAEILHYGREADTVTIAASLGGQRAGEEILHLRYMARRLLLETNPPAELLPMPCRQCTPPVRSLRRAWPDGPHDRDLYSRCGACGDEMTAEEYDVNARRWVAYYKAHQQRPVLGRPSMAST